MKVKELIETLLQYNQDSVVNICVRYIGKNNGKRFTVFDETELIVVAHGKIGYEVDLFYENSNNLLKLNEDAWNDKMKEYNKLNKLGDQDES